MVLYLFSFFYDMKFTPVGYELPAWFLASKDPVEPERWTCGPAGFTPLGPVGGPWDAPGAVVAVAPVAPAVPDVPGWDGSFGGVRLVIVLSLIHI